MGPDLGEHPPSIDRRVLGTPVWQCAHRQSGEPIGRTAVNITWCVVGMELPKDGRKSRSNFGYLNYHVAVRKHDRKMQGLRRWTRAEYRRRGCITLSHCEQSERKRNN